jgi:uncharacterized protein (DUF885 family)
MPDGPMIRFFSRIAPLLFAAAVLLQLSACNSPTSDVPKAPKTYTPEEIAKATERANAFFDRAFERLLDNSPELCARIGDKRNNDRWDDLSDTGLENKLRLSEALLRELQDSVAFDALDKQAKLSYTLFKKDRENEIAQYRFRHYGYPVNQMYGVQSETISFLVNLHKVENIADARAYLARLRALPGRFEQVVEQLRIRESEGIVLPKAIFPLVVETCKNLLSGYPMQEISAAKRREEGGTHPLYRDFEKKYNALPAAERAKAGDLLAEAASAVKNEVRQAYQSLLDFLNDQEKRAPTDVGVWRFPEGEDFYSLQLQLITTTNLGAEEIHEIGKTEVLRIQEEMKTLLPKMGFKGTLPEFFAKIRQGGPEYFYPNTPAGVKRYLDDTRVIVDRVRPVLDQYFITQPRSPLEVRSVEPYRNQAAGKAFYEGPSADLTRPGVYYVNTFDMRVVPKYSMEALAYHEAIPGHHMQVAIAQEMSKLPKFRRFYSDYIAYSEGWGLYAELLGKEMGFYTDPLSDFGRLAQELYRACRLVVDTGIHGKKWTREEAVRYYLDNSPETEAASTKMVNRHIVMPGQATAYKIGMIRILELRQAARERLGDRFDLQKFHEVVLTNGPLPLDVLEELVNE